MQVVSLIILKLKDDQSGALEKRYSKNPLIQISLYNVLIIDCVFPHFRSDCQRADKARGLPSDRVPGGCPRRCGAYGQRLRPKCVHTCHYIWTHYR